MMDDLQPPYTPEQLRELEHADELEKLRDELNGEWSNAMRTRHHEAQYKVHCMRTRFATELRTLLSENTEEYFENVQDKIHALLKKYGEPACPVIFVDGEYHSDYSEEVEAKLNEKKQDYAVYHLIAKMKEYVLKHKLSELEIPL